MTEHTHPADLPPETLIPFSAFEHLMPGTHRKMIERNSRRGTFIPGIRMTDRSPMLFEAGRVATWLAARMAPLQQAPLEAGATTIVKVDEFDLNRRYTGAELKALLKPLITGVAQ